MSRAIRRALHPVALRGEDLHQEGPHQGIVFDNEDRATHLSSRPAGAAQ